MMNIDLSKYRVVLKKDYTKKFGRVSEVVGLTIESIGPHVSVGSCCHIKADKFSKPVIAEVVGFRDNKILLMPFGSMGGIGPGSIVEAQDKPIMVKVGHGLLGRVLNGLGEPMDGKGERDFDDEFPSTNVPPDPLKRRRIKEPLSLGVKPIDGLLTIGKGQRVGIFAGSGVGKSTLMG
ncbi:MAG: EscN/YscN/HrcN family type III secretion system ATPase, partial [Firmicutes bacterium]|nr:EscN/YscN/HrcN family type III secretion system ATPase [Bacillota bacterium]